MWWQAPLFVFVFLQAGAAQPPAAGSRAGAGLVAPTAHQLSHDPVESLLDDDRDDIEKRVDATHPHQDEKAVPEPVGLLRLVLLPLTAHQVPESDGAEGHEAEVERVHIAPVLHGAVQGGGAARNHNRRHTQDQHHVVDRRFPALQTVLLTGRLLPARLHPDSGTPQPALVTPAHDVSQHRDDPLQEEVEEEDGGSAADETIENQEYFPSYGRWCGHAEAWRGVTQKLKSWPTVSLRNFFFTAYQ